MFSVLKKFSTFLLLILTIILLSNGLIKISLAQDVNCLTNPCFKVNKLLEPCNLALAMPPQLNDTDAGDIVNMTYYIGNSREAKCWCNREFYELLSNCTVCLSSPTVNATVKPLDEYKDECKTFGYEFQESSNNPVTTEIQPAEKGPNKFLLAFGISSLVTLFGSLAFCLYIARIRRKKASAYEKLKSDFYSSKGRGIEISGRNVVNENDEKGDLYSPSTLMPPPLAHQPQQNEQQQQAIDNINSVGMYGQQQYYVDASQSQIPTSRESYEYSDNANIVGGSNSNNNGDYIYQRYPS